MKKTSTSLLSLILILGLISLNAMSSAVKDPVGKWKFSAPGAPYGYDQGIIDITKDADELKASISFAGMDYRFTLEKLKFEEEKISFSLYLEGENIYVLMSFSEDDKISGKALYSEGEIMIFATRDKEE
ncbi:MAG: hypothetical protein KFF49_09690 [Bacteroidales bacterium]|nr:hypothetical protein [Bacteroidales bacterium]